MANGQLDRFGRTLQGLSAGLQGRGPEFTQGLRQSNREDAKLKQQQDSERAKTAFIDANAALNLLDQGRVDLVAQLYGRRLNAAENIDGVDFNGSQQISTLANLAVQGDEEARVNLRETLTNGVIVGRSLGIPELQVDEPSALDVARTEKLQAETTQIESGEGSRGLASAKTEILADGTVIQALPGGKVDVRNPAGELVTGQDRLDALSKSEKFQLTSRQKQADIAVDKAERIAAATNRASRVSALTSELSGKSRSAKRGAINLNQASNLIEKAAQGLTGKGKVFLGRIFPGIDVTDEGALEQSLKLLALDELQKFKGPTTDFEFRVTEDIAGSLGSGKSANRARVRSLQRAGWFVQREFEQFQAHVKSGGDPDNFGFNFGEPIKTKKGIFTLQDIQDTAVDGNLSIEETLKRLNQ